MRLKAEATITPWGPTIDRPKTAADALDYALRIFGDMEGARSLGVTYAYKMLEWLAAYSIGIANTHEQGVENAATAYNDARVDNRKATLEQCMSAAISAYFATVSISSLSPDLSIEIISDRIRSTDAGKVLSPDAIRQIAKTIVTG